MPGPSASRRTCSTNPRTSWRGARYSTTATRSPPLPPVTRRPPRPR
ncbi:hypothetical protein R2601_03733 [Salipiger bermudensis HTCC2601]|uniref:Uncharacterized protein n=1 Tax=Salipiger bermudensis (strain DSM 26914 / JCM 13377 / KCTC 12554 / HTCC2601) TaxID=314265 RepID=Q0FW99_SALBH|nr:hypothetical protein R2601_03733 [Salipiger bermudensis HTCC2601]